MADFDQLLKDLKKKKGVEGAPEKEATAQSFGEFYGASPKKKELTVIESETGSGPSGQPLPTSPTSPQRELGIPSPGIPSEAAPFAPVEGMGRTAPATNPLGEALVNTFLPSDDPDADPSLGKQLGLEAARGMADVNKNLAAIPGTLYDYAGAPFRMIGLDVPKSSELANTPGLPGLNPFKDINDYITSQEKDADQYHKDAKIDAEVEKGIIENVKNGEYSNAFQSAGLNIARSLPALIGMGLTSGVAGAAGAGAVTTQTAMASPFIAQKWREIADDPTMSEGAKIINSLGTGYSETIFEDKIGSLGLIKQAAKLLKEGGKEAAEEFTKKGFKETMEEGYKKFFPLTAPVSNALEEGATQYSQNVVAKLTGEKPDQELMEGVYESMAQGGAFGAPIGAIPSAGKFINKSLLSNVVASPNAEVLTPTIQTKLDEQLQNGEITEQEHQEALDFLVKATAINQTIPPSVQGEGRAASIDLIDQRNQIQAQVSELEQSKANTDSAFIPAIDTQIQELSTQADKINKSIAVVSAATPEVAESETVVKETLPAATTPAESIAETVQSEEVLQQTNNENNTQTISDESIIDTTNGKNNETQGKGRQERLLSTDQSAVDATAAPSEEMISATEISPNKGVKASVKRAAEEVSDLYEIRANDGQTIFNSFKDKKVVDPFEDINPGEAEGNRIDAEKIPPILRSTYKRLEDAGMIVSDVDDNYYLTEQGKEVVDAIAGRLQTRKGIKSGTDLFPFDAALPPEEIAQLRGRLNPNELKIADQQLQDTHGITIKDIEDYEYSQKPSSPASEPGDADSLSKDVQQPKSDREGSRTKDSAGAKVQKDEPRKENVTSLKDRIFDQSDVKGALDFLDSIKIKSKGVQSTVLPVAELYNAAIDAIKASIVAGNSVKNAIQAGVDYLQEKGAKKEEIDGFDAQMQETLMSYDPKKAKETTLRNKDVEQKRKEYGFDEPVERSGTTEAEFQEQAQKKIEEGVDVNDIIDSVLNEQKPISGVESVILAQYQATKEAELLDINRQVEEKKNAGVTNFETLVDKRNKVLDDLLRAYDASEASGTIASDALRARKVKVLQDYSLANMFIRKRKAGGNVPLTPAQIKEVESAYKALTIANEKLQKKITELEEQQSKQAGEVTLKKLRKEIDSEKKAKREQSKEDIKKEREDLFKEVDKILKNQRSTLSANPIPVELIPVIGKIAKTYLKEGTITLEGIVDKLHSDFKDRIEGLTKRDIRDAFSGYNNEQRETREKLEDDLTELKKEAKLVSQIEDAEAGVKQLKKGSPREVSESEKVKELRAQLKEVEGDSKGLSAVKSRLRKQISDIETRLKNKDYEPIVREPIKFDEEAIKLKDAYRKLKFNFDVAVKKDERARRSTLEKYYDKAVEVANIPRALMATADLSAPLRQGLVATIANPITAGKAFKEMFRQWGSETKSDRWLADLKESPGWELMEKSKLYIADKNNLNIAAKEDEFMTNLAEKIPGAGILVKASERAYVGYLNKLRADLFSQGVDLLQNQGITFQSNPKAYTALASYINSTTGRGSLGKLESSAKTLNTVFFSPRLMASRLQLLTNWANPAYYKNTPAPIRRMYFKDMAKFIAFGTSILALASLAGAEVEKDPRSSDFGKIKVGDTRWDIWGGFQQYVRLFAQMITGEKKSSVSGKIKEIGKGFGKGSKLDETVRFFRGKLAPTPAFFTNWYDGKNIIGEPFDMKQEIPKMLFPLVGQGLIDAYKDIGPSSLLTVGVPSVFGVGVQTYRANNFLQRGVDDKSIDLLRRKKVGSIEPQVDRITINDPKTDEKRSMTDAEYKKYYNLWSDYIKADLEENREEYEEMSIQEFDKKFSSIKGRATRHAKAELFPEEEEE